MHRTVSRFLPRLTSLAFAACAALAVVPALASAEVIAVNTTEDRPLALGACEGAPGDCTLRDAMNIANFTPGPNTIVLPAGHLQLTVHGSEENEGVTGDLDAIEDTKTTIEGAGARKTVIDATGLEDRVFQVMARASLSLSKLTITGGLAVDRNGGGLLAESESFVRLDEVAVVGNVSSKGGRGGGLGFDAAEAAIHASVIAHNRNSGDGGGIWSVQTELSLVNSTIASNEADTSLYPESPSWGAYGGGMEISGGHLEMRNVTIAGNTIHDGNGGNEGSGAAINGAPATAALVNTLIYGNTGSEVHAPGQCDAVLKSEGHNLEQQPPEFEANIERCFEEGTALIADPRLGPLANNGGETDTMALLGGSPAINAADAAKCPSTDQRGLPRPSLGGCDIGAFEVQPTPSATSVPPSPAPAITAPGISRKGKVEVKRAGNTFLVIPGFSLTCPASDPTCTGTIKARAPKLKIKGAGTSAAKKVPIGKANFSVAPGKTAKLSLKLNAKGAEMLRLLGKVKAQLEITSQAPGGPKATVKATLKLKLPAGGK